MNALKAVFLTPLALLALQFTQGPSLAPSGNGRFEVSFTVDESTDVEVAIVSLRDSTIVCHLAAGVLGSNPPAPLAANTLSQTISWDGKNDMGQTVDAPAESLTVRVRAGMSARLDNIVGDNPYFFTTKTGYGQAGGGLASDESGNLYVYGFANNMNSATLRKYDGAGNYLSTVYPYPANLSLAQVAGHGVISLPDNGYNPKTWATRIPAFSSLLLETSAYGGYAMLMPVAGEGKLTLIGGEFSQPKVLPLNTDGSLGSVSPETPFISAPSLSGYYFCCCPVFYGLSADMKSGYLSGIFPMTTGYTVIDTGFWRDGRVYKADMATHAARVLISLDSVPVASAERSAVLGGEDFAAIHGVAEDDSGHLFVCDRLHGRISVYDTSGVFIRGLPLAHPDMVTIRNRTVYATERMANNHLGSWVPGYINLVKFTDWRTDPAPACTLRLGREWVDDLKSKTSLVTTSGGSEVNIWLYYAQSNIVGFRDTGNGFEKFKDFSEARPTDMSPGFDKIAVDRRNETVYFNHSWGGLFKVEEWGNPAVKPCSTSSGQRLGAADLSISPDNQLYLHENNWAGPLTRYSLDHYHAPVLFPNTGTNTMQSQLYGRMGMPGGYGEKGLAVGYDKKVAYFVIKDSPRSGGQFGITVFPDSASRDSTSTYDLMVTLSTGTGVGGGVKLDRVGNVYVGTPVRPAGRPVPAGYESPLVNGSSRYDYAVGSVIRFLPDATGTIGGWPSVSIGHDRVYAPVYSPFSGNCSDGDCCTCRSPRFDLDPYGRLFIPDALTARVTVVDNNDNPILDFGAYGNMDSRGHLPGSLVPTPAIPLAWPVGVAASENFIYVTDMRNSRLVRVKMDYQLENMHLPETAASVAAGLVPAATLAAAPNPFNPAVVVTLTGELARGASLKVFDVSGKRVADLSGSLSNGMATWNASGHASGVYVLVAEKGRISIKKKVIYSK